MLREIDACADFDTDEVHARVKYSQTIRRMKSRSRSLRHSALSHS